MAAGRFASRVACWLMVGVCAAGAQGAVSLRVTVKSAAASHARGQVVAFLTPVSLTSSRGDGGVHAMPAGRSFVLTQKNKMFSPHLLVVPTGSSVEFPNLDPFFHNVFSLFNGRRFDLGLYEAGSRRSVRFDHDGVSYIFCNIHPEMGAVIVSLSTPYYAVSNEDGSVLMLNVPAGEYELNVWAENVSTSDLAAMKQRVHVTEQGLKVPAMTLKATASTMNHHPNKFGEEYKKLEKDPY